MTTSRRRLEWVACFLGAFLLSALSVTYGADPIVIDFEDENIDIWDFIDEPPENLDANDNGPSTWRIVDSDLGFDGKVLTQDSNIWGEPNDHMLMGTIALVNTQKFQNFRLDVDVMANDNDGMGLVWGYQEDTGYHYRFQMMNDRWPEVPSLDGFNGPYMISHKRISNSTPWYEVMEVIEFDEYIPYTQGFGELNHWTLEVEDGNFTITTTDSFGDQNIMTGSDTSYKSGYVGIQLYAQAGIEFDNFTITPLGGGGVTGDFNGNGALDANDIDLLSQAVLDGNNPAEFDLNADQLVNEADRKVWIGDLVPTYAGDADLNGEFQSSDFVTVFLAGEYEDGVPGNSTWATGDWDGNKDFTSGDFVYAFLDGGYEQGPKPVAAVPEPTSFGLLIVGLIGVRCFSRRHR